MKKNILLSGVGGSLFPYLIESLRSDYNLFLIDSNEIVKKIYPKENIFIVPLVLEDNFLEAIDKIIKENQIEFYIPLIDEEILRVFNLQSTFPNLKLICPNEKFADLCLNKQKLMKELSNQGISSLKTLSYSQFINSEIDFPVFLKPNIGRGSRGIFKVSNKEQFDAYFLLESYKPEDIIIQEYLEGVEYTVSVVVNNLNKLIAIVPKRIITKKGITINAITEKNEDINKICKEIVNKLNPCGPFNVQLTIVNDVIKIFEINPRFSTTSILTCEAGINEFKLCIESYNNNNVEFLEDFKENLYLYRRWDNIFYE